MLFFLTCCTLVKPPPQLSLIPTDPPPLSQEVLSSWNEEFLQALDRQIAFYERSPERVWRLGDRLVSTDDLEETLQAIRALAHQPPASILQALQTRFDWYRTPGDDAQDGLLVTGYYAPIIAARRHPDSRFRYPIYQPPPDLQTRWVGEEGEKRRVVGRLVAGKWVPYYTRAEIDGAGVLRGRGLEIAYTDDPFALYLLHVEGAGYLVFPDEPMCLVNYAADNGYPYTSLGTLFLREGKISLEQMSLSQIRRYFQTHPSELFSYLWQNKRYIFFQEICPAVPPRGSLGLPLTPGYSIATDPHLFPPGAVALLLTSQPVVNRKGEVTRYTPLRRFVLNQDSGGAIKGPKRVDLFWGKGNTAEIIAGHMKQPGRLYFLLKRKPEEPDYLMSEK